MTGIALKVAGQVHDTWTESRVTRSIAALAGTFRLRVSDRAPGRNTPRIARIGDECEISFGSETVIRGYIDGVGIAYGPTEHVITVTGRDATGDLADCSVPSKPGEWSNQALERIAADLARPFGITVRTDAPTGPNFEKFRIEEGETVSEALTRMCRMRGVLPWSDGTGGLVIGRPVRSSTSTRLERGKNILSASGRASLGDRFSEYSIRGQQKGGDWLSPEAAAHVSATSMDHGVTRHRPLTILADQGVSQDDAQMRVDWEASVRAARSRAISITVQGWTETEGGPLWKPGRLVQVADDWLGIDGEMLIATTEQMASIRGTLTVLSLTAPTALDAKPDPAPKSIGGSDIWI